MKIAVVHSFYDSAEPSGENIVVEAQVEALTSVGHDVLVVAERTDHRKHQPLFRSRTASRVVTGRGRSPMSAIRGFDPDVVHIHNLFPNWSTEWLRQCDYPIAATIHNFRALCAAGTLFRDGEECFSCPEGDRLQALRHRCYRDSVAGSAALYLAGAGDLHRNTLLRRADHTFFLSARAAEIYRGFGLVSSHSVVPNFVAEAGPQVAVTRGDHWVYVGRLSREKGVDQMVRHWPRDSGLVIYGSGPLETELAHDLPDNVRLMGFVPHERVPEILDSCRGLIFPSVTPENSPMIYLEALSRGRPVVAKVGNSVADDVQQFGTGAVFDSWDKIADCVSVTEADLLRWGTAARARFDDSYSSTAWLASTERTYRSIQAARSDRI